MASSVWNAAPLEEQRLMSVTPEVHMPAQVLAVRNLSKTFAGNTVLANLDFNLVAGQIHALVGENGSGKSTFIKCLAGFHAPDEGSEIVIGGDRKALPYSASNALQFGLGFVHQNLALIPTLSVAENIALYKRYSTPLLGRIDWHSLKSAASEALSGFASHIDPALPINRLAQADKTLVAIARGLALSGTGSKVLVLDEPTAALPVEEVDHLLRALKRLAAQGVAHLCIAPPAGSARSRRHGDGTEGRKTRSDRERFRSVRGQPSRAYRRTLAAEHGAEARVRKTA
jgi:ribose transport system ATP-binding protein